MKIRIPEMTIAVPKLSLRPWRWALLPLLALALTLTWGRDGALATEPVPTNDAFASAKIVGALPYQDAVNIATATTAANDPPACASYGHSVWYSYTPTVSQTVEVSAAGNAIGAIGGSEKDTLVAAYTGLKGALVLVGCNDDARFIGSSFFKLSVTAGTKYYFLVGNFGGNPGGKVVFHINPQSTATPAIDFNLVSASAGAVPFNRCDTRKKDMKCLVAPGSTFTVSLYLDRLIGLPNPDVDAKAGYTSAGTAFWYTPGLTVKPGSEVWTWPQCNAPSANGAFPGAYYVSCLDTGNESVYTGVLVSVNFNCPPYKTKETITIVHGTGGAGTGDASVGDETGSLVTEFTFAAAPLHRVETLVINCDNYFPWDVDGNGIITLFGDIFEVTNHFNELKPTP